MIHLDNRYLSLATPRKSVHLIRVICGYNASRSTFDDDCIVAGEFQIGARGVARAAPAQRYSLSQPKRSPSFPATAPQRAGCSTRSPSRSRHEEPQLAGRCVLELLKRFDGHQIATYGLTGVPILQSCILQDNRYRGLLVRKERKQHGSLKLIEGVIDPNEPVILIDDSVSSGMCMTEGTERLEAAGLRVEGAICLVRFGWQNGYAIMQERGYHMEVRLRHLDRLHRPHGRRRTTARRTRRSGFQSSSGPGKSARAISSCGARALSDF